jgi:hypothetical protein
MICYKSLTINNLYMPFFDKTIFKTHTRCLLTHILLSLLTRSSSLRDCIANQCGHRSGRLCLSPQSLALTDQLDFHCGSADLAPTFKTTTIYELTIIQN